MQDNKEKIKDEKLLILAVVGMPATGKSEVLKTLVDKYNFYHLYYGGITIDEVKRRGLEVNEVNERFVREDMRKSGDMGIYSRFMVPKIEEAIKNGYKRIILESMYNIWEYELIKEKYGENFKVLAIHSDTEKRIQRANARADRPLTRDEMNSRQISEAKNLGKGTVISLADYHIVNNGVHMYNFESDVDYFIKYNLKLREVKKLMDNKTEAKLVVGNLEEEIKKGKAADSFSGWISQKENLNYLQLTDEKGEQILNLKEGEVRWCQWGVNVGDESNGKGEFFMRPVLIFKKLSTNVFWGLPTTSKTKNGSWFYNVDKPEVKTVILNQIKLIDKRRLGEKIVELSESEVLKIKEAFKKIV